MRVRVMGGILLAMGSAVITTFSEEVKRPEVPALRLPIDGSASPSPFPEIFLDWVRDALVRDNVVRSGGRIAPATLASPNSKAIIHAGTGHWRDIPNIRNCCES
jgi:hypothetical protein